MLSAVLAGIIGVLLLVQFSHVVRLGREEERAEVARRDGLTRARESARSDPAAEEAAAAGFETALEPRIALIIDDLGYSMNETVTGLLDVPWPLAAAVLPGTPSEKLVARAAHDRGRVVLLHLPLEPQGYPEQDPGPFAILVSHSPSEIRDIFRRALDEIPFAEGVNNHMGSRATEDGRVMAVLIKEIRERGLFFVDSYTTPNSLAGDVARGMRVPYQRCRLFIDDETESVGEIRERLEELGRHARRHGSALGIGHPRRSTLQALREALPILEREGIRVVSVRDILILPEPS